MSSLYLSGSVTLDGSGDGTIRLPSVPVFQRWTIERVTFTITGGQNNLGGEGRIFKNDAIAPKFIDGTNTPWNDVYGGALELLPAELLLVVFSLCSAGEVGTASIQGIRETL
jgi:hypothetical protein